MERSDRERIESLERRVESLERHLFPREIMLVRGSEPDLITERMEG